MIGSGIGGLGRHLRGFPDPEGTRAAPAVSPFFIPGRLINLGSGHVSIKHGLKGPNHSVVTACSTGRPRDWRRWRDSSMLGDADVMVAGGAESAVNRTWHRGLRRLPGAIHKFQRRSRHRPRAPTTRTATASSWARAQACVVLEEYEHAKARGAKIYAELIGYGLSGDAYHITAPSEDGDGAFRCHERGAVSALAWLRARSTTSTPTAPRRRWATRSNSGAVQRIIGDDGYKTISMSSTKSAIGHLLGRGGRCGVDFLRCWRYRDRAASADAEPRGAGEALC